MREDVLMDRTAWMDEFLRELGEYHGDGARHAADTVLATAGGLRLAVRRQEPVPTKGLGLALIVPEITSWNATLCVGHGRGGTIGWELLRLRKHNPFRAEANESKLRAFLADIPGYLDRPHYPAVPWSSLEGDHLASFVDALGWAAGITRRTNPGG